MKRLGLVVWIVVLTVGDAVCAEPAHWPEPVLPKDAMFFLDVPAPDRTLTAIQSYVNSIMGFPILPDLQQAFRTTLLDGVTLNSVDPTKPLGGMALDDNFDGDPKLLFYFGVSDGKAFEKDFTDAYTGKSLLGHEKDLMVYTTPDETTYYVKLAGNYVIAGNDRDAVKRLAAVRDLPKLLTERANARITGDFFVYASRHVFDTLEKELPEGFKDMEMLWAVDKTISASEATEMRQAAEGVARDALDQPQSVTLAASISGRDLSFFLRLSPRPGSALAKWVADNPGDPSLPYVPAIPDRAFTATVAHVNPASLRPLLDYVDKNLFAHWVLDTTEEKQRDELLSALREYMRDYSGEMMYAGYLPASTAEGAPRVHDLYALGVRDAAGARQLLDEHRDVVFPFLRDRDLLKEGLVESTVREAMDGGMTAYRTVLAASIEKKENAAKRLLHGKSFSTYVRTQGKTLLLSSDPKMLDSTEKRLVSDASAVFHPLESHFPGPKWSMTRTSVAGLVRMFQSIWEGLPSSPPKEDSDQAMSALLAGLPEPPPGSAIFSFVMPRDGDVAMKVVVPESEVTYAKLLIMRSMIMSRQADKDEVNLSAPEEE